MYISSLNKWRDNEAVKEFILHNSFALLINTTSGKPWATHLPLDLRPTNQGFEIVGHIAKANKQWHTFTHDITVLAVFQGAHSYISPSLYVSKNVPTWNYLAVHVYGNIKVVDTHEMQEILRFQMAKYEQLNGSKMSFDEIPESILKEDYNGLIAFKIEVTEVHASRKLSQNRDEQSFKQVVDALQQSANEHQRAIAQEMKNDRNL